MPGAVSELQAMANKMVDDAYAKAKELEREAETLAKTKAAMTAEIDKLDKQRTEKQDALAALDKKIAAADGKLTEAQQRSADKLVAQAKDADERKEAAIKAEKQAKTAEAAVVRVRAQVQGLLTEARATVSRASAQAQTTAKAIDDQLAALIVP